jgi:CrcB protein
VSWQNAVLVALGGAIGSLLRWAVIVAAGARFGAALPWGTLIVNVAGSFAIGVVAELAVGAVAGVTPAVRLFLATGICGGFTTFSTFTLDALTLTRDGNPGYAFVYVAASIALGLAALYVGIVTARLITSHA